MGTKGATGVILIFLGVTTMVGAVTGNLAGMFAGLFDPNDLGTPSGQKAVPYNVFNGLLKNGGGLFNIWKSILP